MTLLVGVLCSNGAVIAADRQAMHGAMGQMTVGQAVTKVRIIGSHTLFASSGHGGLGQQLSAIVEGKGLQFSAVSYAQSIADLQNHFRVLVNRALQTAGLAAPLIGTPAALPDAWCGNLLAAPFRDGLKLVEITPQVAVEHMTEEIPFISMGSGKGSADFFLGFQRKIYWPTSLPTVREGALAAYWTVKHAIDMKISGVGFDVDVCVVEPKDQTFIARKLDDTELTEHTDFIEAAEDALRGVRDQMTSANAAAVEAPPTLNEK